MSTYLALRQTLRRLLARPPAPRCLSRVRPAHGPGIWAARAILVLWLAASGIAARGAPDEQAVDPQGPSEEETSPLAPAPETSERASRPPRSPRGALERDRHLSLRISLESRYDDNILQLNAKNLNRLDGNPSSTRFRITSADDTIAIGRLDLKWMTRPIPKRQTVLGASADVYRYSRNDIKSYQELGLFALQEITASRRHLATVRAWANRIPSFYLRQLTDADASFAAGHRIRDELSYAQNEYGLAYNQELVNDRLDARLAGARQRRNYNARFNERDSTDNLGSITLHGRPLESSILELGAGYEIGNLQARGDLPSSPILDDDISYRHHAVSLEANISWRGRARGHVEAAAERETRDFTTENQFDLVHSGRRDDRRGYRVRAVQRLGGRFDLAFEARRLTKHSRFPLTVAATDDETDYVENRYSLGVVWSFGL